MSTKLPEKLGHRELLNERQRLLLAELRDVNSHLSILLSLPEHERPYVAVCKKIDNLIRHWAAAEASAEPA